MKPKLYLAISIILCGISVTFAGLSMLYGIAIPRDFKNAYITPEGTWTHALIDLQNKDDVKELARSVGYELHVLRDTKKLIIRSANYDFVAAVSGILAALIATKGIFVAKSGQRTGLRPAADNGTTWRKLQ